MMVTMPTRSQYLERMILIGTMSKNPPVPAATDPAIGNFCGIAHIDW